MADELGDRYEIGARVGVGGMAEVFEARDRRLGRKVAIKFLRADLADPRARERFNREARAAASFSHPNAVTIYDVGEVDARPYLVLEFVEGRNLAEVLSERGHLGPEESVAIIGQVLEALGAAHAQGLVHRDVKPSNILLTADRTAKLADFGIAKAIGDATGDMTATGQLIGTPKYLSPEQVNGDPATPQSDLYAIGVVLYEMLAGEPPFSGETPIATALAHQQAAVPPLASRRPGLPPTLVAAVERVLQKDPARRFLDAEAMRHALMATVDDATLPDVIAPTAVLTTPRAERARCRPSRRAALVGAVAVLLVAGLVLALTGGDDTVTSKPPSTTAPSPRTAPPTTVPSTGTPTTGIRSITTPRTIEALIALIAANPAAYGEHGKDLLKRLQDVQRSATKPGKSTQKSAAKAIEEIGKWMNEGTLDRTIGTLAQQILQPFTTK